MALDYRRGLFELLDGIYDGRTGAQVAGRPLQEDILDLVHFEPRDPVNASGVIES
jgi:hypothetical protein